MVSLLGILLCPLNIAHEIVTGFPQVLLVSEVGLKACWVSKDCSLPGPHLYCTDICDPVALYSVLALPS